MSVAKLKDSVLALPTKERHEFVAGVNRLESDYGDVPGETLDQLAAGSSAVWKYKAIYRLADAVWHISITHLANRCGRWFEKKTVTFLVRSFRLNGEGL